MKREISNMDDVIDSRDVIERIEELESQLEDGPLERDDAEELATLQNLAAQCEDYADDWQHGETLIRDSYFTKYAQELLEDCGDLPKNLPHYIEIDWKATARNIRFDYTSVVFGDVIYWIR